MWKLLRKNVSRAQLVGFAVANLIGLSIVILAIQFYTDVKPVFNDEESFISKDFLIISKSVTTAGAIMGNSGAFTDAEVADLERQPWCRRVGRFVSSEYSTLAAMGVSQNNRRAMRTQFFFESIPSEFIDIDPDEWEFDPENPEVPVIVSRDYLSLYNFGFAAAQGLPRVSEGQAGNLPMSFTLSGNGHSDVMPGRIVGFSNRLNTIIVPEQFMRWSNDRYGDGRPQQPLRVALEVSRPGDVKIDEYMKEHNYEIAGDKMSSSKAYYFMTIIISIVIIVGVIISLLSFFVLMLSIYLLLQKNTRKLQDLLLLGYSPAQVSKPYRLMVISINATVLLVAILLMIVARVYYMDTLSQLGTKGGSLLPAIIVAVVIMAAITIGNLLAIRRKVAALWLHKS
ncbi:MAG: ABC transporter permease [Muribaculaceae bacterium]|nr:ABC transporter permease [Muribaculaceae bacterium]